MLTRKTCFIDSNWNANDGVGRGDIPVGRRFVPGSWCSSIFHGMANLFWTLQIDILGNSMKADAFSLNQFSRWKIENRRVEEICTIKDVNECISYVTESNSL